MAGRQAGIAEVLRVPDAGRRDCGSARRRENSRRARIKRERDRAFVRGIRPGHFPGRS